MTQNTNHAKFCFHALANTLPMIHVIYQDSSNSHLPQKPDSSQIDLSFDPKSWNLHFLSQTKKALPNISNLRTNIPYTSCLNCPNRLSPPIPTDSHTCFTNLPNYLHFKIFDLKLKICQNQPSRLYQCPKHPPYNTLNMSTYLPCQPNHSNPDSPNCCPIHVKFWKPWT